MTLLPFGSRVVPSLEQLIKIDEHNLANIETLRPGRRSKNIREHFAFHNAVTRALGFRLMIRFALRAAALLPFLATLDEKLDVTLDLPEKSSHGRRGGLPALITKDARSELKAYRMHCDALRRKLSTLYFKGTALQWLIDVVNHRRVPLLALIEDHGVPTYLSTQLVLEKCFEIARVADDFGRKWTENAMRLKHCRTTDIDRAMRHEVEDQKAYNTVSDSDEHTWYARMSITMDRAHTPIFKTKFSGLRSS
jgi:hypothetical protein